MATFETVYASLPTEPHAKGAAFERLCQWWLETDPVYTDQLKQVWLWDDWPGRWGPDTGIDLVAETHTGDLWAIQAKAYDANYAVTKADVDSFLSESNRPAFAYRLLVTTTDRIGANGRRVLQGQEKDVGLVLRGDLASREVVWPAQVSDLRAPQPAAKRPRPHQDEALDKIVTGVGTGGRGRVIMACGTGKTLVQLWAHERFESRRTLVLVPSLFLVQQSLTEWTANRQRPFRSLAVCSDATVVRGSDAIIESVNELGLPVTTDPTEIRTFLQGAGDRVIFSTYQSSARVAEALAGTDLTFDVLIADEAHQLAGRVDRDFGTALDDARLPATRRLFFTATPRYFTGKIQGRADARELSVSSMDKTTDFGPELHRLSFGEAIDRELLSDYRVVVVGVTDAEVDTLAADGAFVQLEDTDAVVDARSLARLVGFAKAMRDYDLRQTITFHSRVREARRFATDLAALLPHLPEADVPQGDYRFAAVDGTMPTGERRRRLDRLRETGSDAWRWWPTRVVSPKGSMSRRSRGWRSSTRVARRWTSCRRWAGRFGSVPTNRWAQL